MKLLATLLLFTASFMSMAQLVQYTPFATTSMGRYVNQNTIARNIDSQVTVSVSETVNVGFGTCNRITDDVTYRVYISSNATLESYDKVISTAVMTFPNCDRSSKYRDVRLGMRVTFSKSDLNNGTFGNTAYLIVTRQKYNQTYDRTISVKAFNIVPTAFKDRYLIVDNWPTASNRRFKFRFAQGGTIVSSGSYVYQIRRLNTNGTHGHTYVYKNSSASGVTGWLPVGSASYPGQIQILIYPSTYETNAHNNRLIAACNGNCPPQ